MSEAWANALTQSEPARSGIEQKLMAIYLCLRGMNGAEPGATLPARKWLEEQCADPRLPPDFGDKVLKKARALDCDACMRATGEALADAARLATEGRMPERAAKLRDANILYRKAMGLGAPEQFRRATGRLIDTVMMTGNRHAGHAMRPVDLKAAHRAHV